MSKFSFKQRKSSWIAADKAELLNMLECSLPNLKCSVCQSTKFWLADNFEGPPEEHKRGKMLFPGPTEFFPLKAITIVNLICNDCGFIMPFDEHTLLDRAGMISTNDQGAQSGE